ncbi:arginyltransferase [Nevskia sp.]|uniref:arginyltransferase n=1 Tax=Nevskia sp. TaxID=1929292 RepID=UPI003F6FFCC4
MTMQSLRLLMGSAHACGYLEDRHARSAFVDPAFPLDPGVYGALLDQGFRRSGDYAYRPMCMNCRACQSARILSQEFVPDRAQRRCWQRNQDLQLSITLRLTDEHYALYRRYLAARHQNGGMDPEDADAFREFLACGWGATEFWEFRLAQELVAVAVIDRVPQGLSAVYTFFDPNRTSRGLGTYAILSQIDRARAESLPHVYLGYWVSGSAKMDYKRRFQPLEVLRGGHWQRLENE